VAHHLPLADGGAAGVPQADGDPQTKFAEKLGIPVQRINEIVNGKRGITAETAWLFSDALGTSPQFWMNLQVMYDLTKARPEKHVKRIAAAS
jgi:addiction module HigA family antidote